MRINSYCGSLPFFLLGILLAITLSSTVSAYAVTQTTPQSASSQFGIMQIDQREYDVSDVNSSNVKVSGTINNFNPTDANVTIVFTLPDGTTKSFEITTDSKGNFETTFPLDINSQKGIYTVYSSYAGTTIGALSFNVRQVSVPSSSLQTNPTQPSQILSNNNITNSVQPVSNSNVQLASNTPSKLPPWIKHIFVWYGQGQISDDELLSTIKYLVQNKIIDIESNVTLSSSNVIQSSNPTSQHAPSSQPTPNSVGNYPVAIQINMKKDQIEFGEPLTFQINFNPEIDNTPVEIKIKNSTGQVVTQLDGSAIQYNTDYKDTIPYRITTIPILPNGEYTLEVQLGPDGQILGKEITKFAYVNNTNSVGNRYKNYFPTFLDIGTDFNFNVYSSFMWFPDIDPCIFSCKKIVTYNIADSNCTYGFNREIDGCYSIAIIEFENETDAKKYGATSNQWQGTPSSAGNFQAITDISAINSDSKQCFNYAGEFFSANGPSGLLKCTDDRFVVMVDSNDNIASEMINSVIKKIDSNPPT